MLAYPARMDELGFHVLKYQGRTPMLAACKLCGVKFFTPADMVDDAVAADRYLAQKYAAHDCHSVENGSARRRGMTLVGRSMH